MLTEGLPPLKTWASEPYDFKEGEAAKYEKGDSAGEVEAKSAVLTVTPSSMSTVAKSATIAGLGDDVTLFFVKVIRVDASDVTLISGTQVYIY